MKSLKIFSGSLRDHYADRCSYGSSVHNPLENGNVIRKIKNSVTENRFLFRKRGKFYA